MPAKDLTPMTPFDQGRHSALTGGQGMRKLAIVVPPAFIAHEKE
jgi:hypothetical protein